MRVRLLLNPHEDWLVESKRWYKGGNVLPTTFARAVEAKLKEKNT